MSGGADQTGMEHEPPRVSARACAEGRTRRLIATPPLNPSPPTPPPTRAPQVHTIEIPASLHHRLSPEQRDKLQEYASGHPDSRKQIVAIEREMEGGASFEDALKKAGGPGK